MILRCTKNSKKEKDGINITYLAGDHIPQCDNYVFTQWPNTVSIRMISDVHSDVKLEEGKRNIKFEFNEINNEGIKCMP